MNRNFIADLSPAIRLSLVIFFVNLSQSYGSDNYKKYLTEELDATVKNIGQVITERELSKKQFHYRQARIHYKHVELFVEYHSPYEAKYHINGPLVPKHDPEFGKIIFEPNGFQLIEQLLFEEETNDSSVINPVARNLSFRLANAKKYYHTLKTEDHLLPEMSQLELYRIAALNLNGYDATITLENITETKYCLDGILVCMESFRAINLSKDSENILRNLHKKIRKAQQFIDKNNDYNTFNRLGFIRQYLLPLYGILIDFHHSLDMPWSNIKSAVRLTEKYPFGAESFNMRFFSNYYYDTVNIVLRAEIGKKLFFDPALSGNGKRSCANCHRPDKAFTDGLRKSLHLNEQDFVARNAPTLLNVAFQQSFFHDGKSYQLEDQVLKVITNKDEMAGNMEQIIAYINNNEWYKTHFRNAFKGLNNNITSYTILNCIAEYERTLVSLNSRFDQYLRGDDSKLTAREINGYNLFAGKALCGSCHFFPLFNGTVPPAFYDTEFEVIGTPEDPENSKIDRDPGRGEISRMSVQESGFKTPTIRNITLTAPYMHNGVYRTLDEILEFYHRGGGKGFGFPIENQTLPFDTLILTPSEKEDIILFMQSLTDTTSYPR